MQQQLISAKLNLIWRISRTISTKSALLQGSQGDLRSFTAMPSNLDQIPDVDIDPSGKFKYILIQVKDNESKAEKFIVRGYKSCGYHVDILDLVEPSITKHKCKAKCVGGGRILHDPTVKSILVYGYSQGFGRADHSIAQKLLKEKFPDYNDIQWSNEGY